ncbi:MAG: hypothetical protein H8D58_03205 [Candidatus Marinimicrobia bacterium]|nr:hypothetical protein [Candidatus Neomarinimicrobiota bacterium]
MTPRLKILIATFGISILILLADRFSADSDSAPKKPSSQPKTSKSSKSSLTKTMGIGSRQFKPISSGVKSLTGWKRNPFEIEYTETPVQSSPSKDSEKGNSVRLATLNTIIIQSIYEIGNDAVAVIEGKAYRTGDYLNNMLIEKIEPRKITFKIGGKSYAVDFGS